ncbi:MAG: hypothetical protein OXP11_07105 [Gammaproteobacteria bacterium]|nr:hypothetical protein [Gammaproteobacteria bacterium]
MNNGKMSVGLSQRIRLEWLERTAALARAGNDRTAAHDALDEMLAGELSVGSNTRRNSRAKTIITLLKIWFDGPPQVAALREAGQSLLPTLPSVDRLAIHWGMMMAVYPFWGAVATSVGRLLRLQGAASASQVQRRMRELYGDRETVSHATNRVLRSCVDWGVLADAKSRSVYEPSMNLEIVPPKLAAWLAEALLTGHMDPASSTHLLNHPSLFPFRVTPVDGRELVAHSARLELLQGIDDDLIMLRSRNS